MIMHISDKTLGVLTAAALSTAALVASLPAAAADPSPERAAPAILAQADEAAPMPTATGKQSKEDRVEAEIKSLHQRLHITADQEQQWDAVAAVMRSNAVEMGGLVQQRAQGASTMSAVDDLRSYQQIAEAHAQELSKLVPPFETLYGVMSEEQKQNADVVFGHLHRHAQANKG
jgi:hypothetical protein